MGGRIEWRRGVRLERVVEKEVEDREDIDNVGEGYERDEGFSLEQIPVEEPYLVKWRPARRRMVYTPVDNDAESEAEGAMEDVRVEWEWEFVVEGRMAGREDDVQSDISSEWIGVADDVDSQGWDGSQGGWEFCR